MNVKTIAPITGVIHNLTAQLLIEEIMYNEVANLDFDAHCQECPNEEHDTCWESVGNETILIGAWKFDDDTKLWDIDKSLGDYAAIVREINTQVVYSEYTRSCAMCSPCYPGQGDLDTPGTYLTYDLPPSMY